MIKKQSITQATFLVSVINLVGMPLGFLTSILVASFFGAKGLTDAFYYAQQILELIAGFLVSSIPLILIPIFSKLREQEGDTSAWQLINPVYTVSLIGLTVLAFILYISSNAVLDLISGFSGSTLETTQKIFVRLLPVMIMMGISEIQIAIINVYQQFTLPAFACFLYRIAMPLAILLLTGYLSIYSMVVGVILGMTIQTGICYYYLKKHCQDFSFSLNFKEQKGALQDVWVSFIPLFIINLANCINATVQKSIASGLSEGSFASLTFAQGIISIPITIMVYPFAGIMFANFSIKFAKHNSEELVHLLYKSLQSLWFIAIPTSIFIIFFHQPLVRILYQRGAFDAKASAMTATALALYALGFFAASGVYITTRFYFATRSLREAVFVSIPMATFEILMNFISSRMIGHLGIALTRSTANILSHLISWQIFKRKFTNLSPMYLFRQLIRIGFLSLLAGVPTYLIYTLFTHNNHYSLFQEIILLFAAIFCLFSLYIAFSIILKFPEIAVYKDLLKRGWRKLCFVMGRV